MAKSESLFTKLWQVLRKYWFVLSVVAVVVLAIGVRVYKLDTLPPSLYWEEVALGYDAYSIFRTGKDHHGNFLPLIAFPSFGDYKPALYFYAIVPWLALTGLSAWAVRLPSAVAGVFIVIAVGLLARRLTPSGNVWRQRVTQVLAMLVTAVSPWAVQFSRGGWEVNLATAFITWGSYFAFTAVEKAKVKWGRALLAFFLLALAMYTYHATRLVAPLLGGVFLLYWLWVYGKKILTQLFIVGVIFTVFISPLLISTRDKTTQQRFAETSIFSVGWAVQQSNHYRELAGNSVVNRVIFHRYLFNTHLIAGNYFKHFTPQFLFVSGDENVRHSTQMYGLFYLWESIFLLIGLYLWLRNWRAERAVLLVWLLVGILPASLTTAAPHALRILPTLAVWMLLITEGVVGASYWLRNWVSSVMPKQVAKLPLQGIFVTAIVIVYLVQFGLFWRFYSSIYAKIYTADWQYGYKEMIEEVVRQQKNSPAAAIYMTRELGRPAMYYWFFTATDPRQVQAAEATAKKDQGEFLEFQNISFINSVNEAKPGIIVSSEEGYQQLMAKHTNIVLLKKIEDSLHRNVWYVYHLP